MPGIGVIHLVRVGNDLTLLERFLRSYREHSAGVAHQLVILFKGLGAGEVHDHGRLLGDLPHRREFIPDTGFDLNAYFDAAHRLDYDYFCFLNSYSRILGDDWLAKLHREATREGVGLVAASGSWMSVAGGYGAQGGPGGAERPPSLLAKVKDALLDRTPGMLQRRAWGLTLRLSGALKPGRNFAPFPNYHIRTNAFMAARATLLRIKVGSMRTKFSAHKFESGLDGLTNQVLRLGQRVLVVGRDGRAYEPEQWPESGTLWQGRQENLLVADNQTDAYLSADPKFAAKLSFSAWGRRSRTA